MGLPGSIDARIYIDSFGLIRLIVTVTCAARILFGKETLSFAEASAEILT